MKKKKSAEKVTMVNLWGKTSNEIDPKEKKDDGTIRSCI